MKLKILALLVLPVAGGGLACVSSGSIQMASARHIKDCDWKDIEVTDFKDNESVSKATWVAECKGVKYRCHASDGCKR